jgi:hypothetical protein
MISSMTEFGDGYLGLLEEGPPIGMGGTMLNLSMVLLSILLFPQRVLMCKSVLGLADLGRSEKDDESSMPPGGEIDLDDREEASGTSL